VLDPALGRPKTGGIAPSGPADGHRPSPRRRPPLAALGPDFVRPPNAAQGARSRRGMQEKATGIKAQVETVKRQDLQARILRRSSPEPERTPHNGIATGRSSMPTAGRQRRTVPRNSQCRGRAATRHQRQVPRRGQQVDSVQWTKAVGDSPYRKSWLGGSRILDVPETWDAFRGRGKKFLKAKGAIGRTPANLRR